MIIVVFEDEMGDADGGIDIPCKIIKKKALLSHSIQILTIDFGCLIVKLSKLMFLTVSDVLLKMTTKNAHNPFCPRNLCINTSFSHIEKHLISEWNFPESYSDDYDINEENFRKVCTDFVGKLSITGNEMAEIRYKQGVSLKIHSGLNIDVHE